ncbi:DUF1775 domain-containing protein [Actinoplanes sp. KI2]|uniref:DUF1775 domain-containing protein n=1 Tax=Actinoplanes sp. KI2 TaxID=2983315 RepID=UPI0021D5B798|nr:DUF1775 domain-containing protein [Actinoplanes sp. KI2]MCU7728085.1 DUF1775 domain-containing protein [Actinoplanes sp. KI2]
MRHFHLARRAGVPALAAAVGALIAGPALADATVSPTTSVQGSGDNLTFHVTNTGTAPLATVTLKIPDDTPVAEAYPLSVDDWAPKIQMKTLSTPLTTEHGLQATQTTSSITWLAVGGHQLAPGQSADLPIALGPLPTLSSMQFTVSATYANGTPAPAMPPVSLTLTPAAPGQAVTGHDHGGAAATDPDSAAEDAEFKKAVDDATRGPSILSIGGWAIAGLALLAGAVYFLRGRHRATDEDDEPEDEQPEAAAEPQKDEKEPVTAGKWSLK